MTASFLERVAASTRRHVEARKKNIPVESFDLSRTANDFFLSLKRGPSPRIIAEVKGRSPSQGVLKDAFDPVEVALSYGRVGAAAVSVLTEPDHFGGSLDFIPRIRAQAPGLPLLQKDFIVDSYQIFESKHVGADAILLIVALLGEETLQDFLKIAADLGLACLVEVHTADELEIALRSDAKILGINNRDLKSLAVSLDVSRQLIREVPQGPLFVSESGIETHEQIVDLQERGFHAFLIGSHLMRSADPSDALISLLGTHG